MSSRLLGTLRDILKPTLVAALLLAMLGSPRLAIAEPEGIVPRGSRLGRTVRAATKHFLPTVRRLGGQITLLADRVQCRLPGRFKRAFGWARDVSPLAMGTFAVKKFKQDRKFLLWYGACSQIATRVGLPAAASVGLLSAKAAGLLYFGSAFVDLAVVAVREHVRREDRGASFLDTLDRLGGEYQQTISYRREVNRRYMRRFHSPRDSRPNPLARLAQPLGL